MARNVPDKLDHERSSAEGCVSRTGQTLPPHPSPRRCYAPPLLTSGRPASVPRRLSALRAGSVAIGRRKACIRTYQISSIASIVVWDRRSGRPRTAICAGRQRWRVDRAARKAMHEGCSRAAKNIEGQREENKQACVQVVSTQLRQASTRRTHRLEVERRREMRVRQMAPCLASTQEAI
ncbi:hypothetical protein BJ912DRAFT_990046, partial [Pholiota molesta]